jgi:hypothetical protein
VLYILPGSPNHSIVEQFTVMRGLLVAVTSDNNQHLDSDGQQLRVEGTITVLLSADTQAQRNIRSTEVRKQLTWKHKPYILSSPKCTWELTTYLHTHIAVSYSSM